MSVMRLRESRRLQALARVAIVSTATAPSILMACSPSGLKLLHVASMCHLCSHLQIVVAAVSLGLPMHHALCVGLRVASMVRRGRYGRDQAAKAFSFIGAFLVSAVHE